MQGQWLQRAVGNAGARLAAIRDRVLDAARLERHHVALDLNAGTGLLTWDLLRRAPEGGTYALARDRQAGEGLRQQAERLPEVERPAILVGDPAELPELLALRGEPDFRFDAIVGRNALPRQARPEAMGIVAGLLQPGGRLSLAETSARGGQRLYDLLDLAPLGDDLAARVRAAEEAFVEAATESGADDLAEQAEQAGLVDIRVEADRQAGDLLVGQATLDRWFALPAAGAAESRPSYAQCLAEQISPAELDRVRAEFQRRLAGQTVPWQTTTLFLTARRPNK